MYNSKDLKVIFVVAFVFLLLDFIYLSSIKGYFENQIMYVQRVPLEMNVGATILCYLLLIFGIHYFIIKPERSIKEAFILGILIYGVFETTNKALFSDWKWTTVFMDTLWGGVLFSLTIYIFRKHASKYIGL
jgi:uncharacterized membrane protein